MNNKKAVMLVVGVACVAYGVGYIKGQSHVINTVGEAATREALFYLAAHDFTRKLSGQ